MRSWSESSKNSNSTTLKCLTKRPWNSANKSSNPLHWSPFFEGSKTWRVWKCLTPIYFRDAEWFSSSPSSEKIWLFKERSRNCTSMKSPPNWRASFSRGSFSFGRRTSRPSKKDTWPKFGRFTRFPWRRLWTSGDKTWSCWKSSISSGKEVICSWFSRCFFEDGQANFSSNLNSVSSRGKLSENKRKSKTSWEEK